MPWIGRPGRPRTTGTLGQVKTISGSNIGDYTLGNDLWMAHNRSLFAQGVDEILLWNVITQTENGGTPATSSDYVLQWELLADMIDTLAAEAPKRSRPAARPRQVRCDQDPAGGRTMSAPIQSVSAALGPAPSPIAPLSAAMRRLDLSSSTPQDQRDALAAVLIGVTVALEEACGRCLVRRPAASANLSREALTTLPLIEIPFAQPIESVAALWHDSEAHDDFGVAFDGAALVDPAEYRVHSSLGTQAILLRELLALVLASLRYARRCASRSRAATSRSPTPRLT